MMTEKRGNGGGKEGGPESKMPLMAKEEDREAAWSESERHPGSEDGKTQRKEWKRASGGG